MLLQIDAQKCSKCQQIYPLTSFHKDRGSSTGVYLQCKFCRSNKINEDIGLLPIGTKRCSSCKEVFPKTSNYFYTRNDNSNIGFRSRCRKCYYNSHSKERKRNY